MRREIFEKFWRLGNYTAQAMLFIASTVVEDRVKRKRNASKRTIFGKTIRIIQKTARKKVHRNLTSLNFVKSVIVQGITTQRNVLKITKEKTLHTVNFAIARGTIPQKNVIRTREEKIITKKWVSLLVQMGGQGKIQRKKINQALPNGASSISPLLTIQ